MHWIELSIISALLLGVYDVFKKRAVHGNAVIPVLFISVVTSSLLWVPGTWLSAGDQSVPEWFYVAPLGLRGHLELFAKSLLVGSSWMLAYFAVKHLPMSVAGPVRSTGPLWTLLGALVILGERPSGQQGLGIALILIAFLAFSVVSQKEGIRFHKDKWIWLIIGGTLLGSISALYDRYLLGMRGYSAATVQAWFSHYLVVVMTLPMLGWYKRWWPRGTFQWRWSIPLIGITLLLADYAYFHALRSEEALISVVASLRRSAVVVPFVAGFLFYQEHNFRWKLPACFCCWQGFGCCIASSAGDKNWNFYLSQSINSENLGRYV
ncbi:MAG: DMT family transporter [Verrucomicrobia bacterium]|nr:DMT family transporter [Verrucomicrobiota bacterium]